MKKIILISGAIIVILIAGLVISLNSNAGNQGALLEDLDTFTVERGTLSLTVDSKGSVHANQSAILFWEIPGQVGGVSVTPGMQVSAGDVLATLETTSLPAHIILAQSEIVSAQNALDELFQSQAQQAAALKALDDAQKALEDALNPELAQAQALVEIAKAESAVETAQRQLDILTAPVPQSAIDQAYANLLLAEEKLEATKDLIRKIEQQIKFGVAGLPAMLPNEFRNKIRTEYRKALRQALEGLQLQLTQDQLAYDGSLNRYNHLFVPPDPIEVAVAKANLAAAKVQLEDSKQGWERIKDGPSKGEIAVLEAKLADARREWERLKDGPDPDDIALLEAQIAASQAALMQTKITAPFDGLITRVETQSGDQVNPGTLAFRIDDVSHLLVDLEISEIDIHRIDVGQDVVLTFESVLAKEYQGEVIEVAMVGTQELGAVKFNVVVELHEADEYVRVGMTSEANIVTNQKEDVLLVPNRAIRILEGDKVVYVLGAEYPGIGSQSQSQGSSNPFSRFISRTSGLRPVRIEIGETSNFLSEVISDDLKPGDQVVIDPPTELTNIPERQASSGFGFEHP